MKMVGFQKEKGKNKKEEEGDVLERERKKEERGIRWGFRERKQKKRLLVDVQQG